MTSPHPQSLSQLVDEAYAAFADEKRPDSIEHSPLYDREDCEVLRRLTDAPLRAIADDDIGAYSGWAMTTAGNEADYRYFLPRILQLACEDPTYLGAEPSLLAYRIDRAGWHAMSEAKKDAVASIFRWRFVEALHAHPDEASDLDATWCGLAALGWPANETFETVRNANGLNPAVQLAKLISFEAEHIRSHGCIHDPFGHAPDSTRREIAEFLLSEEMEGMLFAAREEASDEIEALYLAPAIGWIEALRT